MSSSTTTARDEPPTITISDSSDLTIEIIEKKVNWQHGRRSIENSSKKVLALFRVNKSKLIESEKYFQAMFKRFREANSQTISLEGDQAKSMEVWLRIFHSAESLSSLPYDSVSIADTWHIISASEKYSFDLTRLVNWFAKWFSAKELQVGPGVEDQIAFSRQLIFPCYQFDDAVNFQLQTRFLVYNFHRHITDDNPTTLSGPHSRPRVIQQLNAARGRLRIILHTELFTAISKIVGTADCRCKEDTIYKYLRELQRIGVWPLETAFDNSSVRDVLDRLKSFDSSHMGKSSREGRDRKAAAYVKSLKHEVTQLRDNGAKIQENCKALRTDVDALKGLLTQNGIPLPPGLDRDLPCEVEAVPPVAADAAAENILRAPGTGNCPCARDWDDIVETARVKTAEYFEGLCLDCMDASENLTTEDKEHDFWTHADKVGSWNHGNGRTKHGKPTWYFSFMGRKHDRRFDHTRPSR